MENPKRTTKFVSSIAFTEADLTLGSVNNDISPTNSQAFTNHKTLCSSKTSSLPEITIYILVDSSHFENKISHDFTLLCWQNIDNVSKEALFKEENKSIPSNIDI